MLVHLWRHFLHSLIPFRPTAGWSPSLHAVGERPGKLRHTMDTCQRKRGRRDRRCVSLTAVSKCIYLFRNANSRRPWPLSDQTALLQKVQLLAFQLYFLLWSFICLSSRLCLWFSLCLSSSFIDFYVTLSHPNPEAYCSLISSIFRPI